MYICVCVYIYKYIYKIEIHIPSCNHHPKQDTEHFYNPQNSLLPPSSQAPTCQPSKRQLVSDFQHHGFVLPAFVLHICGNAQYGL